MATPDADDQIDGLFNPDRNPVLLAIEDLADLEVHETYDRLHDLLNSTSDERRIFEGDLDLRGIGFSNVSLFNTEVKGDILLEPGQVLRLFDVSVLGEIRGENATVLQNGCNQEELTAMLDPAVECGLLSESRRQEIVEIEDPRLRQAAVDIIIKEVEHMKEVTDHIETARKRGQLDGSDVEFLNKIEDHRHRHRVFRILVKQKSRSDDDQREKK